VPEVPGGFADRDFCLESAGGCPRARGFFIAGRCHAARSPNSRARSVATRSISFVGMVSESGIVGEATVRNELAARAAVYSRGNARFLRNGRVIQVERR